VCKIIIAEFLGIYFLGHRGHPLLTLVVILGGYSEHCVLNVLVLIHFGLVICVLGLNSGGLSFLSAMPMRMNLVTVDGQKRSKKVREKEHHFARLSFSFSI